jgi:hypothetical protein
MRRMGIPGTRVIGVGLLVGFLLNLTGWVGNNVLLGDMWRAVTIPDGYAAWRDSPWRDFFSLLPDFLYGLAIAWLCVAARSTFSGWITCALAAGILVALVGGVTTYFAIANSGFIPWTLAAASFVLVLATKLPLALLAGRLLEPNHNH